jgi:PTH1 family peptidyl-tRNA hydrolase
LKYLIAGLGNIGPKYTNTRHNIGFMTLDALAKASNVVFEDKRYGFRSDFRFKGRTFVLLKPNTYMNRSGSAVNYWLQKEKIHHENLLVIVDDLALPFGSLRLRAKGSDGGHNGIADIITRLERSTFARLRFGIGNEFSKGKQVDYVLGQWTEEEEKLLPERMDLCIQMIKSFGTIGIHRTMNQFNNK